MINWRNILGNIAAIWTYTLTVYPGLNAERIWASIQDGTFIIHAFNLFIMYITFNYGKSESLVAK